MKAHELARELGISQKELVNFLQQRRLTRNAAAPLAPGAIEAARSAFKPASVAVKLEPNGDRKAVLPPSLSVKDLAEKPEQARPTATNRHRPRPRRPWQDVDPRRHPQDAGRGG
jgi:hypothetical protein